MTSGRAAHCGPTAADASRQQRWPGRDARRVALFLACCLAAVSAPGVVAAQNASSDGEAVLTPTLWPCCCVAVHNARFSVPADHLSRASVDSPSRGAAATLLAFQAATTNWASATAGQNFIGWTAGTASPCNWTGVQCDTRSRVTSLCALPATCLVALAVMTVGACSHMPRHFAACASASRSRDLRTGWQIERLPCYHSAGLTVALLAAVKSLSETSSARCTGSCRGWRFRGSFPHRWVSCRRCRP